MLPKTNSLNHQYELPTIDAINKHVAKYFNIECDIVSDHTNNNNKAFCMIAIILCRDVGKFSLTEIANAYTYHSYKSVSRHIKQAKLAPEILEHVQNIKKLIFLEQNNQIKS